MWNVESCDLYIDEEKTQTIYNSRTLHDVISVYSIEFEIQ